MSDEEDYDWNTPWNEADIPQIEKKAKPVIERKLAFISLPLSCLVCPCPSVLLKPWIYDI